MKILYSCYNYVIIAPRYCVWHDGVVLTRWGRGPLGARASRRLAFTPDCQGYDCVRLVINGKRKKFRVHRLIARFFLPARPSLKHLLRHVDGNKHNNAVSNLVWGTPLENAQDRELHGRTSRGVKHSKATKKGLRRSRNESV